MFTHGIRQRRLGTLTKHYRENGAVPRDFHYSGRNNRATTLDEANRIVRFLLTTASIFALALPGRVPGWCWRVVEC